MMAADRLSVRDYRNQVLAVASMLLENQAIISIQECLVPLTDRGVVDSEKRLRNAMASLCNREVLCLKGRGRYGRGSRFDICAKAGSADTLEAEMSHFFFNAGGFASFSEALKALDRQSDNDGRLLGRILANSSDFVPVTLDGWHGFWMASDRQNVPLAGRWHMLELQLLVARGGLNGVSYKWGLHGHLSRLRDRIATGLRDARDLRGMSLGNLIDRVGANLSACLDGSTFDSPLPSMNLGKWYRELTVNYGCRPGLMSAWEMIERGTADQRVILHSFDVQLWLALGQVLKVNAAMLSRGAVVG